MHRALKNVFLVGETSGEEIVDCEGGKTNQSKRYATSSHHPNVLRGKLALVEEGKEFVLKQIAAGVAAFSGALITEELDRFRDITTPDQEKEEEKDDGDDDEGEEEDDEDDEDDEVAAADIIPSEVQPVPSIASERLDDDIFFWHFPEEISQSRYNGRNGSNACSIISILLGYFIRRINPLPIPNEGVLPSNLVHAMCGCINLGNQLYDMSRMSLPSRYLSVEEAAGLLTPYFNITVEQPLPVRLKDDHDLSMVWHQLQLFRTRGGGVAHIIINERTSLFFVTHESIMYIDTHSHGSGGAIVVKGPSTSPRNFCEIVWDLESHGRETFGNLVFADFEM